MQRRNRSELRREGPVKMVWRRAVQFLDSTGAIPTEGIIVIPEGTLPQEIYFPESEKVALNEACEVREHVFVEGFDGGVVAASILDQSSRLSQHEQGQKKTMRFLLFPLLHDHRRTLQASWPSSRGVITCCRKDWALCAESGC